MSNVSYLHKGKSEENGHPVKGRGRGGNWGWGSWSMGAPSSIAARKLPPSLPLPLHIVAPTQRPTDRADDVDLCDVEAREGNGGKTRGDRGRGED